MLAEELSLALLEGNIDSIRSLLESGADVRYVNASNDTPMHDALYGKLSEGAEAEQLSILQMLIDRGAEIDCSGDGKEPPLVIASRRGRFKVVYFLYEQGADPDPLCWTMLHLAAANGTVEDLRLAIEDGNHLEERDHCSRTPFLLSIISGDIAKTQFLLGVGCDRKVRGQYKQTPLEYALDNGHSEIVRCLLNEGFDPNEPCGFYRSPLMIAAYKGDVESVKLLLAFGADIHFNSDFLTVFTSAIESTYSIEVMRILVAAGADINEINGALRRKLTGVVETNDIECTIDDFRLSKHRVFGSNNPQQMNFPFWRAMVRRSCIAEEARDKFDPQREYQEAIWCYSRMGSAFVETPDGRVIEIGGEYEDGWHPDFCIYNDVIVHRGDGEFDIFGYPKEVFPPTDFHTATLVGKHIYLIGNLGYFKERKLGTTQIFRLDIDTLVMERVDAIGESPGWIHNHKAFLTANGIRATGGKVLRMIENKVTTEDNQFDFLLNLETLNWTRI